MADTSLTLLNGNQVSPKDEIFSRNSAGQIGPRLGVVGELVPALDCYKVVVVEKRNDERIIAAIRGMLENIRLQDLSLDYEAIIDTFQSYVDHEDVESLVSTKQLCTQAAPRFGAAFEQALKEFAPYSFKGYHEEALKNALKPLIAAGDAYLIVLSIGFHAQTKLMPSTALNDSVVLPRVDKAIRLLETRLENTLLPGGTVKRSPMASLLLRGKIEWFLYYYPYCGGYSGEAGIVKMTAEANEEEKEKGREERWQGYRASLEIPDYAYYALADTLIELLHRFKTLRAIRLNFDPDDKPLSDPRAIFPQLENEMPVLIAQAPTT
jgi:hypothetical protein